MRERSAFTLVELLVVVAVIALLMGVLLPSLSRARLTAQNIRCQGNERQLGLATQMYLDAQQGKQAFLPILEKLGSGAVVSNRYKAISYLDTYLEGNKEVFLCPSANGATSVLDKLNLEYFEDSATFPAKDVNNDQKYDMFNDLINEYWVNDSSVAEDTAPGAVARYYGVSGQDIRLIKHFTDVIMFMDAIDWIPRHSGRVNVILGDQSIKSLSRVELYSRDRFGSYAEPYSWGNHYPPRH